MDVKGRSFVSAFSVRPGNSLSTDSQKFPMDNVTLLALSAAAAPGQTLRFVAHFHGRLRPWQCLCQKPLHFTRKIRIALIFTNTASQTSVASYRFCAICNVITLTLACLTKAGGEATC